VVFVVGRDVAQALVEPDGVVEQAYGVQLGFEVAGVGDLVQVRVLALDVPEQRLDPALVVGGAGPAEVRSCLSTARMRFSARATPRWSPRTANCGCEATRSTASAAANSPEGPVTSRRLAAFFDRLTERYSA
jgi:hypothetical protein